MPHSFGNTDSDDGVTGTSTALNGVKGITSSSANSGVVGENDAGGSGVFGNSVSGAGVFGTSAKSDGVLGKGAQNGVKGITSSSTDSGVVGENDAGGSGVFGNSVSGAGVFGTSNTGIGILGKGGSLATRFEGDVEVTGDIRLVNADCAEDFDISGTEQIEPGTVMVLDEEGALEPSQRAYDKRVAGVISGAGDFKPGIVLDKQQSRMNRMPVALLGKVYCKVDAKYSPVEVGGLLTSSPTP